MVTQSLYMTQLRTFTGKTESGHKFKTPKMRMKHLSPVFPPPGLNLRIPTDLTHEAYLRQIGGDCEEYADKFENIDEVFNLDSKAMKAKGVPTQQRRYILRCRELLRRGILSFEYLKRRTCLDKVRDN
eukprot:403376209